MRTLKTSLRSAAAWGIALAAFSLGAGCSSYGGEETLTPELKSQCLESFDYVWETIRDKHFDPDLGGLDWDAVRDELRVKVEAAETMSEARAAMSEMLGRLDQSHFQIIPHDVYADLDLEQGSGDHSGVTGIDLRVVDGAALVVMVEADSPAANAGIAPGWIVETIDGKATAPVIETIAEQYAESLYRDAVLAGAISGRLRAPIGTSVAVELQDGDGRTKTYELELVQEKGKTTRLGFLPPVRVWIDTQRLAEGIGYVRFNAFLDPVQIMPAFNAAMESFMDAEGLIIDLRGNGGGLPGMAVGMAGWLVPDGKQSLGTMYMRGTELNLVIFPRAEAFAGPVAVLVDGLSGSCSEFMAGGLQGIGRARVFGSRTMGAALPSVIEKLPHGDGFQYAFADFVTTDGQRLEGHGVIPDDEVLLTREDFLSGRDPVLETATAWIHGHALNQSENVNP